MNKAGKFIIACLEEKGMTQTDLARKMGEDRQSINQQINRLKDLKVERLSEVLEYIGYHLEIVDNGGFSRVSKDLAAEIINKCSPKGFYWFKTDDKYIAIDSTGPYVSCRECSSVEEIEEWLKYRIKFSNCVPKNQ